MGLMINILKDTPGYSWFKRKAGVCEDTEFYPILLGEMKLDVQGDITIPPLRRIIQKWGIA